MTNGLRTGPGTLGAGTKATTMPPTRKSIARMSRGKGEIIARPAAADNCVKAQPIILRAQPESDLFFHKVKLCAGLPSR